MRTAKKNHKGWCIVALLIAFILLVADVILAVFAFMGFRNGDYPTFGNYGIYSVADSADIVPERSAVITDMSLQLERGCAVVFMDESFSYQNRMDMLYLYDWNDDASVLVLTDKDMVHMTEVPASSVKGRAVFTVPFLGWLLASVCTLAGVMILLGIACLLILAVILLIRYLAGGRLEKEIIEDEYYDDGFEEEETESIQEEETVVSEEREGIVINDDLSYEITFEDDSLVEYTFFGEANAVQKLSKIMLAAKEKKNASSISVDEKYAETSSVIIASDRAEESIIISIIDILKNR